MQTVNKVTGADPCRGSQEQRTGDFKPCLANIPGKDKESHREPFRMVLLNVLEGESYGKVSENGRGG